MSHLRSFLLVLLICLPVAVLATGVRIPFLDARTGLPRPPAVPSGDQELAWVHTSTSWTNWERFVSGVARAQQLVPGLHVDDSRAFRDQSFELPELVLSMDGRPGNLRIRWYKLTGDVNTTQWIQALAARDPAPLAVVGGGSSDRALDLARALAAQTTWQGDRPLLFLTTATADELTSEPDAVAPPPEQLRQTRGLLSVYDDRSFRFCFSNRQMAEAVLDFVWERPELRPQLYADVAPFAAASGVIAGLPSKPRTPPPTQRPQVFSVVWNDDPFSTDLYLQFGQVIREKLSPDKEPARMPVGFASWGLPYSVGGFTRPNQYEARVAESIIQQYRELPPQRSLLVLPTVTQPARRLLRTLSDAAPQIAHRMVTVTGDGISLNAVFRDGEFAWPLHSIPVPLVLFMHNNPVDWDPPGPVKDVPPGYELRPPSSTEDVLHFAELTRIVTQAAFGLPCGDPNGLTDAGRLMTRADDLALRLRGRCPPFFDNTGNRLGGTGEYVVVVQPLAPGENGSPTADPRARLDVYRRREDRQWESVRTLTVDQWRTRSPIAEANAE